MIFSCLKEVPWEFQTECCCFPCVPQLGNVFHVAFLNLLGGKVVPLSGMGGCPNIQCGKAGGTWNPVKMSSDLCASGCGMRKNFCFSGVCWWLKIYKRDKIYKRHWLSIISTIMFLFCVSLFDICLFATREYLLNCWLLLLDFPILKVCFTLIMKDLCQFSHAVVLKLISQS